MSRWDCARSSTARGRTCTPWAQLLSLEPCKSMRPERTARVSLRKARAPLVALVDFCADCQLKGWSFTGAGTRSSLAR